MEWLEHAACNGYDTDIFFPADDFTHPDLDARELRVLNTDNKMRADLICDSCPVMLECRRYALENRVMYGQWGGLSESQRNMYQYGGDKAPKVGVRRYKNRGELTPQGVRIVADFRVGGHPDEVAARHGVSPEQVRAEVRKALAAA